MLSWAVTFLVVALIAGILGLSGIAGAATQIAWILFVVFMILFLGCRRLCRFADKQCSGKLCSPSAFMMHPLRPAK